MLDSLKENVCDWYEQNFYRPHAIPVTQQIVAEYIWVKGSPDPDVSSTSFIIYFYSLLAHVDM